MIRVHFYSYDTINTLFIPVGNILYFVDKFSFSKVYGIRVSVKITFFEKTSKTPKMTGEIGNPKRWVVGEKDTLALKFLYQLIFLDRRLPAEIYLWAGLVVGRM
jgi:hypothetical protein